MIKLRQINGTGDWAGMVTVRFKCPGCGDSHDIPVRNAPGKSGPIWTWNQSMEKPTFSPSVLATSGHHVGGKNIGDCWCDYTKRHPDEDKPNFTCYRCHSYVKDGYIQFLGDCTHKLAGQTVELPTMEAA